MKLTKHTNISAKSVKLLEENIGNNYCDPGLDNSFSNVTHQKHKQQKKKYIDIKLKFWINYSLILLLAILQNKVDDVGKGKCLPK